MSTRVYMLVNLVYADSGHVARILQEKPDIAEIDVLDGLCKDWAVENHRAKGNLKKEVIGHV
jgi:hypothetical protein